MADFIKGIELSGLFFFEAVKPVLDAEFPRLRYSAARLGSGSEVLGFDDEMSTDHGWGPRVDVFHDEAGLGEIRGRFSYYPRDVWLYLLAAGWERVGQEEHLMGRAGIAGDELGSAIIAARLARDLMRLGF